MTRIPKKLAAAVCAFAMAVSAAPVIAAPKSPIKPAKVVKNAQVGRLTALKARMTVKVVHPDEVRAKLVAAARKLGGHPMLVTDYALHLKLPPASLVDFMKLAGEQGSVLDKNLTRTDLTEPITQLEGKVRSKGEILERLRGFVDDSNVQATLRIEREMTRLVHELERVKGQLQVQRDQSTWASLQISFRYQKRGRVTYVKSPFKWLNTVDLDRFLRSF